MPPSSDAASSDRMCPMWRAGDHGDVLRGQREDLNIFVAEQVCLGKAMNAIQDQPALAPAHDVKRVAQVGAGEPRRVPARQTAAPVPRAE